MGERGRQWLSDGQAIATEDLKVLFRSRVLFSFPKWAWIQVSARTSHALQIAQPDEGLGGLADERKLGSQRLRVEQVAIIRGAAATDED